MSSELVARRMSFDMWGGKGACGQAGALHWSGLRCSVSWPCRRTRFVRCAHCTQTAATSQITMRAARAATSPARLGAPEARSSLPARAFAETVVVLVENTTTGGSRQAVPGGGAVCGDEERRAEVGARSALRQLTCRSCLNAANEESAVSSAARPRTEHRSAVGAQRRPPQPAPRPGVACCDARALRYASRQAKPNN